MTDWFLVSWLILGVLFGAGITSVFWRLHTRDLHDHYEARIKGWQARYKTALAALAQVNGEAARWQAQLTKRLDQELELERVVSDAYAAGIQREEHK